jgi:predicted component of type VI protein secretion system
VRDILLSRKHCRIEPEEGGWVVLDLGSKNGTRVGHEVITRHTLRDCDTVRIGKIQVSYRAGAYEPPPRGALRHPDTRPADPQEALSGTVLGFQLFDMEADSRASGFPIPKPKGPVPAAPRREVESASHSAPTGLDSTVAAARKPAQARSEPAVFKAPLPKTPPPKAAPPKPIQPAVQAIPTPPAVKPAPPKIEPRQTPVLRSAALDVPATIPAWLAWTYILLACAVGLGALGVVIVRSNPFFESINWLAR